MATKKISELTLRSNADATCQIPTDDSSQTWRITLAQIKTYIQTAIAPITTLGDLIYGAAAGAPTRLAGNTTTTRKVLAQTGTGTVSAAPAWEVPIPPVLRYVSKTGTYTADAAADDVILGDATSAAYTQTLPAAANCAGKVFYLHKTDSSANAITVDANGSETIGGTLTRKLAAQFDKLVIFSDGANWQILVDGCTSEVWLTGDNDRGSVSTAIRRLNTSQKNIGSGVTYADSATLGATFTINETADYEIDYTTESNSTILHWGLSLNSSQLTTAVESINAADRLAIGKTATIAAVGNLNTSMTVKLRLVAGDVVRIHGAISNGTVDVDFTSFRISKVKAA